jgi:uncharacterized OB-fold protein
MSTETHVFPTTGLSQEDFDQSRVITVAWTPRAEYGWDEGAAIGRYLQGLKEGKLLGRICHKCRRRMIPPRMFCEQCFRATDEWFEAADTGTVKTFSLCNITWDMIKLDRPQIPAVIDVDGASTGMGIMHLLGEVDPQAVRVGLKVQAVWKPADQRAGEITDILYWKPM